MSIWEKFEDLTLEFMERRVTELLTRAMYCVAETHRNRAGNAVWAANWRDCTISGGEWWGKTWEKAHKS